MRNRPTGQFGTRRLQGLWLERDREKSGIGGDGRSPAWCVSDRLVADAQPGLAALKGAKPRPGTLDRDFEPLGQELEQLARLRNHDVHMINPPNYLSLPVAEGSGLAQVVGHSPTLMRAVRYL